MHAGTAAACVTVNVRPAIVSVPIRDAPVLAATLNATVPFPLPVAPEVIDNHASLLDAVQGHSADAVTVTLLAPPAALADKLVDERV